MALAILIPTLSSTGINFTPGLGIQFVAVNIRGSCAAAAGRGDEIVALSTAVAGFTHESVPPALGQSLRRSAAAPLWQSWSAAPWQE